MKSRVAAWWRRQSRRGKVVTAGAVTFVALGVVGAATKPPEPATVAALPTVAPAASTTSAGPSGPLASIAPSPRQEPTPVPTPVPTIQGQRAISRADYGAGWPFTVDAGTLRCEAAHAIVFQTPDGTKYGLNGLAAAYADLDPIWAADPSGISPKISIGPLIQDGLTLCP